MEERIRCRLNLRGSDSTIVERNGSGQMRMIGLKSPALSPKAFLITIVSCAVIAGLSSWMLALNFWVLWAICVVAVFVNGLIAHVEDREQS